jgi:hypothetical protein
MSTFYTIAHRRLPGRDGLYKSIPLTIIALAGLFMYSAFGNPLPAQQLFHWMVGLTGLSVFTAAELQGMSPLMRGEQANWGWEAVITLALRAGKSALLGRLRAAMSAGCHRIEVAIAWILEERCNYSEHFDYIALLMLS